MEARPYFLSLTHHSSLKGLEQWTQDRNPSIKMSSSITLLSPFHTLAWLSNSSVVWISSTHSSSSFLVKSFKLENFLLVFAEMILPLCRIFRIQILNPWQVMLLWRNFIYIYDIKSKAISRKNENFYNNKSDANI